MRYYLSIFAILIATPAFAEFRAGAAAVDCTPEQFPVIVNGMFTERIATKALDRLHARALVLDDGTTKIAICVVDSCMMPREFLDKAKALASETTKIPVDRMLISATHTHSAPAVMGCLGTDADPIYPAFLQTQIVRAITQANKALVPAKAGWAVTHAPNHTFNRRWILRSDKIRNDPFGNPTVRANMHVGLAGLDRRLVARSAIRRCGRTCTPATKTRISSARAVRWTTPCRCSPCKPPTANRSACWPIFRCTISDRALFRRTISDYSVTA